MSIIDDADDAALAYMEGTLDHTVADTVPMVEWRWVDGDDVDIAIPPYIDKLAQDWGDGPIDEWCSTWSFTVTRFYKTTPEDRKLYRRRSRIARMMLEQLGEYSSDDAKRLLTVVKESETREHIKTLADQIASHVITFAAQNDLVTAYGTGNYNADLDKWLLTYWLKPSNGPTLGNQDPATKRYIRNLEKWASRVSQTDPNRQSECQERL